MGWFPFLRLAGILCPKRAEYESSQYVLSRHGICVWREMKRRPTSRRCDRSDACDRPVVVSLQLHTHIHLRSTLHVHVTTSFGTEDVSDVSSSERREEKTRKMQGRTFILLFVRRRSQRHLFLFHRWDAFSFSHVKMPYVVH